MKRAVWRIVILGLVAFALVFPQVAFARPEDSDNGCPPRSAQGDTRASETAKDQTFPLNPPANDNAWYQLSNPGNKDR